MSRDPAERMAEVERQLEDLTRDLTIEMGSTAAIVRKLSDARYAVQQAATMLERQRVRAARRSA